MAFGMKQWIGVTLAGMALVAAWRLPPEPVEAPDRGVRTAEQIRFVALRSEVQRTSDVLFRIMWADSLSALTVAGADDDGVAVMVPELGVAVDDQKRRLAERIREQRDRRAPDGPSMAFGYAIQPHNHRREDGAFSPRDRTETYVGTRDGVDYCLQVRVTPERLVAETVAKRVTGADERAAPSSDELGPCRFYLAYGFAGSRIQEWLEGGAVEFALEGDAVEPIPAVDETALYSAVDMVGIYAMRRGLFGTASVTRDVVSAKIDRCLAGLESACAEFFETGGSDYLLTPRQREVVRRSPATGIGSKFGVFTAMRDQRYILADLEADFGREAFRAFWTSDAEVGEAFEDAFGVSTGEWMVQRIDRLIGIDEPGPGVSRKASTGVMMAFGLFLGIAWLRRRERAG